MHNFTLFSPSTLQFTYEKENLQEKHICFSNARITSNLPTSYIQFSEKPISGLLNILNTISKKQQIYFTLPQFFNPETSVQFVRDLITASTYSNIKYIVFDISRYSNDHVLGMQDNCVYEQMVSMFEHSNLPVVYIDSYSKRKLGNKFLGNKTLSIQNVNVEEVDFVELGNISKFLKTIFDLKEDLFSYKISSIRKDTVTKKRLQALIQAYTLN